MCANFNVKEISVIKYLTFASIGDLQTKVKIFNACYCIDLQMETYRFDTYLQTGYMGKGAGDRWTIRLL